VFKKLALASCIGALLGPAHAFPQEIDLENLRRARLMEDLMAGRGAIGGPFTLTDHHGKRRALADFRGRVVVLYFGYTHCPDVCPTDLAQVALLLKEFSSDRQNLQALYVTVDPERDTPHLGEYVRAFHPDIVGLTGTVEEVRAVAERYKAYFAKAPAGAGYLMEHSANLYVLDREGRFAGSLPPGTKADRLGDVVRDVMRPR
jgi:protein SCO1/2